MTAAALVLAALGGGWLSYKVGNYQRTPATAEAVNDTDPLLDDLLAIRAGQPVSMREAAQLVDFELLTSSDQGCRFDQCSVCKSGCCDMVRCQLRCRGEQMLLVQGNPDHPVRYGKRTVLETQINGQPARVVQCEGCLACSWQKKGTALTLVGPRDLAQLVQLVAYVDQRLSDKP
jgi:hypothetical protein